MSPKQSLPKSWSVMQRPGPPKKEWNCFGLWTVFMRWQGVELCTRDKRLKAGPLRGWCHPNNLFLNLDLWCKDLVPPKKNETVSDSGPSLCADRVLDFVQEMGDLKLALYGVGVTQTISSLVLICDAKTWSPKKRIKLFGTLDCLYALIGCWTLYKRWET